MTSRIGIAVSWLAGPALAAALSTIALVAGGGPGFVLLVLVVAVLCLVVVPLAQVLLLRTPRFKGRHFTACGVALLIALGMLPLVAIIGNFNIC